MENRDDIVRERAQERLASIDRESLGEMSIEEVKNTYNEIKAQEQAKEEKITEIAQEHLAQMDRDELGNMSIEAVKNKYNEIKEEVRKDTIISVREAAENILSDNTSLEGVNLQKISNIKKENDLNDMFKEETADDSVKTK